MLVPSSRLADRVSLTVAAYVTMPDAWRDDAVKAQQWLCAAQALTLAALDGAQQALMPLDQGGLHGPPPGP